MFGIIDNWIFFYILCVTKIAATAFTFVFLDTYNGDNKVYNFFISFLVMLGIWTNIWH